MAALLVPASASASERVLDGSFDVITACTPSDCTSPVWAETVDNGGGTGPLCQAGTGSCGYFQGMGMVFASSPPVWAQFGGESVLADPTYSIQQVVNVPAAPATLRFQLFIKDSNATTGAFTVQINGTPVFAAGGTTPGYGAYAPVSIDISPFAGGLRTLRFDVSEANPGGVSTDSFNVDNVSLDAPDHSPVPATPIKKKCKKSKKLKHGKCRKKHKKH
ncbi:MAG: hypothetical protein QOD60_2194 [Solirubrobacterales bacterium]|jgi:hypothetical protein|nr:hypothetical protein [Solirubrobacterales bacterium]